MALLALPSFYVPLFFTLMVVLHPALLELLLIRPDSCALPGQDKAGAG